MASKYEKVLKDLAPLPAEDPSWQQEVEKMKSQIGESTVQMDLLFAAAENFRDEVMDVLAKPFAETKITWTPDSLAKYFRMLRTAKDAMGEVESEINIRLEALTQMLVKSHDEDETGWGMYGAPASTVRMSDGGAVRIEYEPTGKVEDPRKFRTWCVENGLEDSLMLWPSTTQAIVKERLLDGKETPDGIKAYARPKIKLMKPPKMKA
jgi:hypothetical protein